MLRIGLISDTHGYIDPKVFEYFKDCDEIWHAGDIGTCENLNELANFKPFKAVYGNIDDQDIRQAYLENEIFERKGLNFLITHIAGVPPSFGARVKKILIDHKIDVLICGHSHIVKVKKDPLALYINPGAAGKQGFHRMRTLMRMSIENKKITNLELIELGKR